MTSKRSWFLGLAVVALVAAGCDSKSKDETPPPPPGDWTPPAGAVNLLSNGDFSGTGFWQFYDNAATDPAAGSIADCSADGFSGNCMRIVGKNFFDANPWDSALQYKTEDLGADATLTFTSGKSYVVSFRGRASRAITAEVKVQLQGGAWTTALDENVDIPADATVLHTAAFQAAFDAPFSLRFGIAGNNGATDATIEIDDVGVWEY
jgi:hypothetical protein